MLNKEYDELMELELQIFAAEFAKQVDQEILESVIKEAESFKGFMLNDDLFEI